MRAPRWPGSPLAPAALVVLAGIIGFAVQPPHAHGATSPDPFFGTWSLERERSHYAKEMPPEQMTIVMEDAAYGLHYQSSTQYAGGRAGTSDYTASFNGTPALVVGVTGFLAPVSLRRVDGATIEATYTVGLKKIAWSRWSLNADGTELVVTTTYLGKDGESCQNVAAFRRAKSVERAQ
jgi:hypothetical protein